MTEYSNQAAGGNDDAFRFERSGNGFTMSADIDRICQMVAEQVQKAVGEIDFDAIGEEMRQAMANAGEDIRRAMNDVCSGAQRRKGPTHVRVEVRADQPPKTPQRSKKQPEDVIQQHKLVLTMLAEGKISAEEAARLLDALGG